MTQKMTFGKFFYFTVINSNTLKSGNIIEFDKEFNIIKNLYIKEQTIFWNTYWKFLHTLTYHYPINPTDENKNQIKQLINRLRQGGLPCEICTKHFIQFSDQHKIELFYNSNFKLFEYFVMLHNSINKQHNKKILTINDARLLYKNSNIDLQNTFNINIVQLFNQNKIVKFVIEMNTTIRNIIKKNVGL
jgi:hypothetical protein